MNTPSEEMLKEAARHIKKQNNYQKWEQLLPFSNHDFTVDFQRILFIPPVSCEDPVVDEEECSLSLDCIFGTLLKDNYLYILCKNGILYILEVENYSWSMRFPVDRPSQTELLLRKCQAAAVKVEHWIMKRGKG